MSRLRVWCAGASIGYLLGWLAGSNVLKMAEARRLGRPEPRAALSAPVESPEPRIGREAGDAALAWAMENSVVPTRYALGACPDMPCTQLSPGGGLTCCRKGTHNAHVFEGAHARDRKDDTDEGIE
jgi:hypothetical protein